jgi:hypothetical protein
MTFHQLPEYQLTHHQGALDKLANSLADEIMEEYEGIQQGREWDWDQAREQHLEEQIQALEILPVVVIEMMMDHYRILDQLQEDGMTDRERQCYENQPLQLGQKLTISEMDDQLCEAVFGKKEV